MIHEYCEEPTTRSAETARRDVQLNQTLRDSGLLSPAGELPRLIASRWEATAISAVAGAAAFKATDFSANLGTALNPQLRQYRMIHFATHGVLDTRRPALSGIVLSLFNERGEAQPVYLRAMDILEMNLAAELVTLHLARQLWERIHGEGMMGSLAFRQAGARCRRQFVEGSDVAASN